MPPIFCLNFHMGMRTMSDFVANDYTAIAEALRKIKEEEAALEKSNDGDDSDDQPEMCKK